MPLPVPPPPPSTPHTDPPAPTGGSTATNPRRRRWRRLPGPPDVRSGTTGATNESAGSAASAVFYQIPSARPHSDPSTPPSTSAPHPAGPPQVPHRPRRIRAGPDPGVDAFQAGFFPCGWTAGGPARGSALPAPDRPRCPVLPRHRPVQARRIVADRPDFHKIF